MEDFGCIYYIHCKETNRGYVGLHCKPTPDERIRYHFRARTNYLLHNAIKKYGKSAFTVETLCVVPVSALPNMEAYWAEQLETYMWDIPGGYNMVWCGSKPRIGIPISEEVKRILSEKNKGRIFSEETRAKISESQKGNTKGRGNQGIPKPPITEEHREKLRDALRKRVHSEESKQKHRERMTGNTLTKGTTLSEETKEKLRQKATGRKHTEETKERLRGRVVSEETREKLRQASLGKQHSEETKEKCKTFLGREHSEETKRKMSEARKAYWQKKRAE